MHPVICQIGPLTVYSYGVMMAVAVSVCAFLLYKETKRTGLNADVILDIAFWIVVSGIAGSRLFFIFLNFSYFVQNPSEMIMLQHGGLAWQGGLLGATVTAFFLFRKHKLPLLKMFDLFAPYVALGQSIGRWGCFLNGCCYGKPFLRGIYFPVHHASLHPTQLYDSAGLLMIFFLLKSYQKKDHADGKVFFLYLFLASLNRFIVEFFRADHTNVFLSLSIFQIVSIMIMAAAIYANLLLKSQRRA